MAGATLRRTARRDTIASVKRVLAWLAGLAGIATLGRLLAQRRQAGEATPRQEPEAVDQSVDPAEELRRKLAERRPPEPEIVPEPERERESRPVDESLEERRARVHAKAREAIEAMGDEGPAA